MHVPSIKLIEKLKPNQGITRWNTKSKSIKQEKEFQNLQT
jgi:hypothetical protein